MLRQRTRSQARACSRSWVAMTHGAPLAGQLGDQPFQALGAGPVETGEGLVEQQHAGVLDQRPGDQHALALAAGEVAEGLLGERPQADPVERRAAASRSRRPGRRHHGSRDSVPISATSSAETG